MQMLPVALCFVVSCMRYANAGDPAIELLSQSMAYKFSGPANSNFGRSVAFHSLSDSANDARILVGTPRSDIEQSRVLNRTYRGVVIQCPVTASAIQSKADCAGDLRCSQRLDNTTCTTVRNDVYYSTDASQTANANYGNLVRADPSGSRRVMICAHKSRATISSAMNMSTIGSCYTLDRALTGSADSIVTIDRSDQKWNSEMDKMTGTAQQNIGFSGALLQDAALFGDPICLRRYNYEEMVQRFGEAQILANPSKMKVIYAKQFLLQAGMLTHKRADGQPSSFWDVYWNMQLNFGESFSHAYLGFSTAATYASTYRPARHLVLTGAPRFGSRKRGAVFGFSRAFDNEANANSTSTVFFDAGATGPLKIRYRDTTVPLTLQTGSSFGQSVAFADVNGDGIPDLLVGAPHHIAGVQQGGGRVYVFCGLTRESYGLTYVINGSAILSAEDCAKMRGCELSQFGYSIQPLGDIDEDKAEDFAVSAPFEESGGAVYVFHGSKTMCTPLAPGSTLGDLKPLLFERFRLSDLAGSSQSFGTSLDFGADVDGNGFPDMLVGSPLQDAAYILLSMPLLKLEGSLEVISAPATLADIEVQNLGASFGCPPSVFNGKIEQDISHYLSWARATCFAVQICFKAQIQMPKNSKTTIVLNPASVNVSYTVRVDDNPASPLISLMSSGTSIAGQTPIIRKHTEWLWLTLEDAIPVGGNAFSKCVDSYIALGMNASAGMSMNGTVSLLSRKFFSANVTYTASMVNPPTDMKESLANLPQGEYFRMPQKYQSLRLALPLDYACANPPCDCRMTITSLAIPSADSSNTSSSQRFTLNMPSEREKVRFSLRFTVKNSGTQRAALPVVFIALLLPPSALQKTVLPSISGNTVCDRVEQKVEVTGGGVSGEDLSDVEKAAMNEMVAKMNYYYAREYYTSAIKSLDRQAGNNVYTVFRCDINASVVEPGQSIRVEVDVPTNISAHQVGPITARLEAAAMCGANTASTAYARDFSIEFRYKADWDVTITGTNADSAILLENKPLIGASSMKDLMDIGVNMKQTVYVRNQGPSVSPYTNLLINVPIEMMCKFSDPIYSPFNRCESLLYLSSLPSVLTAGSSPIPCSVMIDGRSVSQSDYINHFNFSTLARRKRSADAAESNVDASYSDESVLPAASYSKSKGSKWNRLSIPHRLVYFDDTQGVAQAGCKLGDFYLSKVSNAYKKQFGALADRNATASATCLQVSCPIPFLDPGLTAQVDLNLHLWNTTFIRYLVKSNILQARVITTAYLQPNRTNVRFMLTNDQTRDNDYAYFVLTTIPGSSLLKPVETLPYLLIIGSALGALALLGVFIIVLFRYGVLTPKKYDKVDYEQLARADTPDQADGNGRGRHGDIPNLAADESQDELDAEADSSEEIEPFVVGDNLPWQSGRIAPATIRGAYASHSNDVVDGAPQRNNGNGEQFELLQPRLPPTRDSSLNWTAPLPAPGSGRPAQLQRAQRNVPQSGDFPYLREAAE